MGPKRLLKINIRAIYMRKNKTQTIQYKQHIKTRLSKDASYRRTGVRSCS